MVFEISKDITEGMENILTASHPENIEDAEIFAKFAELFTARADSFQDYINYTANIPSVPGRITTFRADHDEFDNIIKVSYKAFSCYLLHL
mmetsp:Transcript_10253/g.12649  ORF Transcript_10253/g.12649 Transcript_10253/m.12649 type:complete len:91 (+) Transcript_10253:153-425(+)